MNIDEKRRLEAIRLAVSLGGPSANVMNLAREILSFLSPKEKSLAKR